MPTTLSKRNGIVSILLGIMSGVGGCSERLGVEVVLRASMDPDPFTDVRRLRVSVDLDEGARTLGEFRWDQGPVRLPVIASPSVRRVVVEGISEAGRVVSFGATQSLDLLTSPPQAPIRIDFSRVGVLSTWGDGAPDRRVGGRAVQIEDGRWLAVGGQGDDGCLREDTRLFGPRRDQARVGPPLPGGRQGDFSALRLETGEVMVVGGRLSEACSPGVARLPWRLNPLDGRSVRGVAVDWPPGAAVATLSETLILAAGGQGPVAAQDEVYGLDPRTFVDQLVGRLSIPRAEATLVALDRRRALVLGGRTQTATAVTDAAVFEPSRGATLDERILVGGPVAAGLRTAAGSVLVLTPDGRTRTEVKAVVVRQEGELPFGEVSFVTVATGTDTTSVVPLGDGSLLRLGRRRIDWIQLLPRQSVSVADAGGPRPGPFDGPLEGPLIGGVLGDGTALIVDPTGRQYTFNPGPAAILGWRGPGSPLLATEGPTLGRGLVPRRPDRWRLTRDGLEVNQPPDGGDLGEWAVAVDRRWTDFALSVDLRAQPGARALVLWAAEPTRFSYVEVGANLRAGRFGSRSLPCSAVPGPGRPDRPWSARIQILREGRRVRVEQPAGPALECSDDGRPGWLGVGVGLGTVSVRQVQVAGR